MNDNPNIFTLKRVNWFITKHEITTTLLLSKDITTKYTYMSTSNKYNHIEHNIIPPSKLYDKKLNKTSI